MPASFRNLNLENDNKIFGFGIRIAVISIVGNWSLDMQPC
jgi:hypothetical protein